MKKKGDTINPWRGEESSSEAFDSEAENSITPHVVWGC